MRIKFFICLLLLLAFPSFGRTEQGDCPQENFQSLVDFQHHTFERISRASSYEVIAEKKGESVLLASSENSASALIHKNTFDVYQCPILQWRWKIKNVFDQADGRKKSGDDYPIRVYVAFPYDEARASWWQRQKYEFYRTIRGEYPPHSSLNYVWANNHEQSGLLESPYTSRVWMIAVDGGSAHKGSWRSHRRDIVTDYRNAFGEAPPRYARIAVMSDSDDTGQSAIAFVDYIRTSSAQK